MEQFIKLLESLSFEEARVKAIEISQTRFKEARTINQKTSRAQIIRDMQNAPNKTEIIRIAYMQLLASEGKGTVGSAFREKHDNV
jgi:hypothetical protein